MDNVQSHEDCDFQETPEFEESFRDDGVEELRGQLEHNLAGFFLQMKSMHNI